MCFLLTALGTVLSSSLARTRKLALFVNPTSAVYSRLHEPHEDARLRNTHRQEFQC